MIVSNYGFRQLDLAGRLSSNHQQEQHDHHREKRSNILPSMSLRSSPHKGRRWRYYKQLSPDLEDEKEEETATQNMAEQVAQQLIQPQEQKRNRQLQQPIERNSLVTSSSDIADGSPGRRRGLLRHGSKRLISSLWPKSNGTPTRPDSGDSRPTPRPQRSPFSLVRREKLQPPTLPVTNFMEEEDSSNSTPPPPPPTPPPQPTVHTVPLQSSLVSQIVWLRKSTTFPFF